MTDKSLAGWLEQLREAESKPDWRREDLGDDPDESSAKRPLVWRFPSDEALTEFLGNIAERDAEEVSLVLRNLLPRPAALEASHLQFELYVEMLHSGEPDQQARAERMKGDLHFARVLAYYSGETDDLPWEGLQWVRQLLPKSPRAALSTIDAYLYAHLQNLSDNQIFALSDAQAVIRAYYIGLPETQVERRELLYGLEPCQFERLVAALYEAIGYEVELTQQSRDGGRDVIVWRDGAGVAEYVLIECKRYTRTVGVAVPRALLGSVQVSRASAGKVVTTANISREARKEFAKEHSIELVDGLQLVVLLNEHLGADWPRRLDFLVSESRFQRKLSAE